MKIIEKYLTAVGTQLPIRIRRDIKEELRSLLLDEIEAKYGTNAGEEEAKDIISSFGTPYEVGLRYTNNGDVINPGFRELLFLILKIMLGAMTIAFVTIFIMDVLNNSPAGMELFWRIIDIPFQIGAAFLSGTGFVVLLFMLLSKYAPDYSQTLGTGWDIKELDTIRLEDDVNSRAESIITIVVLSVVILLMLMNPGIVSAAERTFAVSGIGLGHQIALENFKLYLIGLIPIWAANLVFQVIILASGHRSRLVYKLENILSGIGGALLVVMIFDSALYEYETGWIGMKVIFLIIASINLAEFIKFGIKTIQERIERKK